MSNTGFFRGGKGPLLISVLLHTSIVVRWIPKVQINGGTGGLTRRPHGNEFLKD